MRAAAGREGQKSGRRLGNCHFKIWSKATQTSRQGHPLLRRKAWGGAGREPATAPRSPPQMRPELCLGKEMFVFQKEKESWPARVLTCFLFTPAYNVHLHTVYTSVQTEVRMHTHTHTYLTRLFPGAYT